MPLDERESKEQLQNYTREKLIDKIMELERKDLALEEEKVAHLKTAAETLDRAVEILKEWVSSRA